MDGSSIRSPVEVATFSQGLGPKHPQGVFPKFGADFQRWGGSTLRSKKKPGWWLKVHPQIMGKCSSIFSLTHIFEMGGSTNHKLARFLDGIFRFSPRMMLTVET